MFWSRRWAPVLVATLAVGGCAVADDRSYGPRLADGGYYGSPGYGWGRSGYGWGGPSRSGYGSGGDRYVSPTPGVSCDKVERVCYDRHGPELSLTREYFGRDAARRLENHVGGNWRRDDVYTPKQGVKCDVRDEVCLKRGDEDYRNTRQQFGRRAAEEVRERDGTIRPSRQVVCNPATEVCARNGGPNVDATRSVFGNRAAKEVRRDKKDN